MTLEREDEPFAVVGGTAHRLPGFEPVRGEVDHLLLGHAQLPDLAGGIDRQV